ncbi:hypothetical protein DFJ73DRAFT_762664 [Zopfochytrium polystomum]|nr:hypothetical protein DFJ73DRAFT_762664 [Zopfochytrium polystomum]
MPYAISVGKPNPAELGNFLEIDFLAPKEFLRPIVSPCERQVALADADWGGRRRAANTLPTLWLFWTEPGSRRGRGSWGPAATAMTTTRMGRPHFSLATGKLKKHARYAWPSGGAAAGGAGQDAPAEGQLVCSDIGVGAILPALSAN